MKKSKKAMLLSALVFPGLGHIYLKHYLSGYLLIAAAIACLYFLLTVSIDRAMNIVNEIQSGNVMLNLEAISTMVTQQSVSEASLSVATIGLGICWLLGILGAYRIGRQMNL